jgi:exopolysaccharide biosynthesis polyprenyl glycosylphosphotransferase
MNEESVMFRRHAAPTGPQLRQEPKLSNELLDGTDGLSSGIAFGSSGLLTAKRWALVSKVILDVVVSAMLIVLLLPVLLAAAVAVAVSSPGPIIYRQTRIGRHGRPFTMYKFRSMRSEAHDIRRGLVDRSDVTGPVFKMRNDPRITAVGRVLRKFSIDELPQLVNVLKGDMSLVGPRPPLPEEVETYGPRERLRLMVTPGLTCIWQVSGRSDIDFATWVELDIAYIDQWTLFGDLLLLVRTIGAVITARGAY